MSFFKKAKDAANNLAHKARETGAPILSATQKKASEAYESAQKSAGDAILSASERIKKSRSGTDTGTDSDSDGN